ncbi:Hypothetical predicted protein [Pelobates cultripes]|uniref:Uncharacterized protein n=1 Tax=Pelobates cultripes TaxID=61616 RepID=A0AAD1R612_PELCU|nr:Hypothetical predicted protein [Pelobates cultripes]
MPQQQIERRAAEHKMADAPAPVIRYPVPLQTDLMDHFSHIEERLEAAFNRFCATLMERMKRAPPAKLPWVREQTRGGTRHKKPSKAKPTSMSAKHPTLGLPGS